MATKARKLRNLLIDRVDLVDKGANPEAHIVLFKRDGAEDQQTITSSDTVWATPKSDGESKEERSLLKAAWDLLAKHLGFAEEQKKVSLGEAVIDVKVNTNLEEVGKGGDTKVSEQKTYTLDELLKSVGDDVRETIKSAFAKQEKELADLRKQLEEMTKRASSENKPDDINKADLPEPVRKRLEDLEKRAKEAEEIAKAEREARIKAEIRKRAEGYANVGEVDKIAEVIYKAQGVSAEFAQDLEKLFKAAHERIEQGALFKELGGAGASVVNDNPVAEFDQLVQKRAEADKISYYEAARKVAAERPDLAKAWFESAPAAPVK